MNEVGSTRVKNLSSVDETNELNKILNLMLQLKSSLYKLGIYDDEVEIKVLPTHLEYLIRTIENNRVCRAYKFYSKDVDEFGFKLGNVKFGKLKIE